MYKVGDRVLVDSDFQGLVNATVIDYFHDGSTGGKPDLPYPQIRVRPDNGGKRLYLDGDDFDMGKITPLVESPVTSPETPAPVAENATNVVSADDVLADCDSFRRSRMQDRQIANAVRHAIAQADMLRQFLAENGITI